MTTPTRRTFLTTALGTAAGLTVGVATPASADDDVTVQAVQWNWRFCQRCYVLFYDGDAAKGICPWGGGHSAAGWNYNVQYDFAGGTNWEIGWRFCPVCFALWWPFEPYPFRHQATSFVYALQYGVGETANRQAHWRFCQACNSLFYWGFADNGFCPSGGGHLARGHDYVMYH